MPRYVALATGNFATLGTWGLCATGTVDGENLGLTLTTAFTGMRTPAFTPGAVTVSGVCLKLNRVIAQTGTIQVHIALNATHVEVVGTLVTLNVSQLPNASVAADNNGGWVYFEFASPVALAGATAYEVEALTSSSSQVIIWRADATALNASKLIVTTANPGALNAGDTFDVITRYQNTTTTVAVVVTMDNTATTDFGSGVAASVAMTVSGAGSSLTYGATGGVNYYLKLSGNLIVYLSGELDIGTSGTHMPSNSTAVLEFDPAVNGDLGLIVRNGGIVNAYGNAITHDRALLAADASGGATSLTTNISTGWKNGDLIGIATTTRTAAQSESKSMGADAVGTAIGTIAALANAHSGSVPTQAELINLTRNVIIRSATATIATYVNLKPASVVVFQYVQFNTLGNNIATKRGIEIETTTGSCSITFCSMIGFRDNGIFVLATSGSGITVSNNVIFDVCQASTSSIDCFRTTAGTTTNTYDSNIIMHLTNGALGTIFRLQSLSDIFTNNIGIGNGSGTSNGCFYIDDASTTQQIGTFSGNVAHSSGTIGLSINSSAGGLISNTTCWRNTGAGVQILAISQIGGPTTFDGLTLFGNGSRNFLMASDNGPLVIVKNAVMNSDASFTTANGLEVASPRYCNMMFQNSTFGATTAHTVADFKSNTGICPHVNFFNCLFSSGTSWSPTSPIDGSFLKAARYQQTANTSRSLYAFGAVNEEATKVNTPSGFAWKLTPSTASFKLIMPGPTQYDTFRIACPANAARTISIFILKDTAYNGNQPRLVILGGVVQGIGSDVTTARTGTTKTITDATNATPIVIASTAHGYHTGDRVLVEGVLTNTAANGIWTITEGVDADHFSLNTSTGNGTYGGGGTANVYEKVTSTAVTPTEDSVVEFYVDCDGTLGNVYVDDIGVV